MVKGGGTFNPQLGDRSTRYNGKGMKGKYKL